MSPIIVVARFLLPWVMYVFSITYSCTCGSVSIHGHSTNLVDNIQDEFMCIWHLSKKEWWIKRIETSINKQSKLFGLVNYCLCIQFTSSLSPTFTCLLSLPLTKRDQKLQRLRLWMVFANDIFLESFLSFHWRREIKSCNACIFGWVRVWFVNHAHNFITP